MENELTVISPEGLEIAQAYLINGSDADTTASIMGIPIEEVHRHLAKREVIRYIDRVFNESGFRNRDKMAAVWDAVLNAKLQDMEESGLGSSKDIVEIMEKMWKFNKEQLELQIKLAETNAPAIQINQQNNISGGDNYNSLLEKIVGGVVDASKS